MITGNEPAYATDHVITDSFGNVEGIEEKRWSGLTIRQHFAAMAMQGILSNSDMMADIIKKRVNLKDILSTVALDSTEAADALIAALNNSNTKE